MSPILKIALPVPLEQLFDYLPPDDAPAESLRPGIRVEVPFRQGRKVGILVEIAQTSALSPERVLQAHSLLDTAPILDERDIQLISWASRYYHHPIGEAFFSALPPLVRKGSMALTDSVRRLFPVAVPDPLKLEQLSRAPKQSELMARLRQSPCGLTASDLAESETRLTTAARALVDKHLAEWREVAVATIPLPVPPPEQACQPNPAQAAAIQAVASAFGTYRTFLLEGITGSGKSEVYLRLAEEALARGRQVMVLLPEINLTPQLEARFRARLRAPVVIYHSGLTDTERHTTWLTMQRGEPSLLLGTRSAVFTSAPGLGLIILDEEHDNAFKQQDGFRYSARDVSIMRASYNHIPVVLGSATPSLESLHNAQRGRSRRLQLPYRAGNAAEPVFQVIDIRAQSLHEGISTQLAGQVRETIARGEQALLFINRRGFAPTLICHDCGWLASCPACDTRMVIHRADHRLRCHHCGLEKSLPLSCPQCGHGALQPLGLGTERAELALNDLFPGVGIARIDRDSTRRKGSLKALLRDIHSGAVSILIGTQMLAKGHHFPAVTLVGIIDVDAGLFSTDFRASEKTAQLITQVAGRAGREDKPGRVVLQTRQPNHPMLATLIKEGYAEFAKAELLEREAADLPPYSFQALWRAEALHTEDAQGFLTMLETLAGPYRNHPLIQILGPTPAPLSRLRNRYRWQLLLQSGQRHMLHATLDHMLTVIPKLENARKVRWSIDVDPADLY